MTSFSLSSSLTIQIPDPEPNLSTPSTRNVRALSIPAAEADAGVKPSAQSPLYHFPRAAVADRTANCERDPPKRLTIASNPIRRGFYAPFPPSPFRLSITRPIEFICPPLVLLIEWPPA
jgi:hypothetical protein